VLELGEDECGAGYLGGAVGVGGDVLRGGPALGEDRLVTARKLPTPGRGDAAAALGGQQLGQIANKLRAERSSIAR
jgi:hypothetical protein